MSTQSTELADLRRMRGRALTNVLIAYEHWQDALARSIGTADVDAWFRTVDAAYELHAAMWVVSSGITLGRVRAAKAALEASRTDRAA